MAIHGHTAGEVTVTAKEKFEVDVLRGLLASPKFLQSKYFYDAEGDRLFQQIMDSPEYYLTNCEHEIFSQQTAGLAETLLKKFDQFDVVELGAGDATKSIYLLKHLSDQGLNYTYYPVDISANVIEYLENTLPAKIPGLQVHGLNDEYLTSVRSLHNLSSNRKLVLFLGANIGNFSPKEAFDFLHSLNEILDAGDLLLIGFDLKKNPKQILAAYNDAAGVTRQFNLNLLHRMNRELEADFNVNRFDHYPTYNPISGACRSYLISLEAQSVRVAGRLIHFKQYEPVSMELSQKYAVEETDEMAIRTGFQPVAYFFDSNRWFMDAVWQKL